MKFFWYALAGGIATASHYAVLLVLVEVFDRSAAPSSSAGALVGAITAYLVNRQLAFRGAGAGHSQALPRFMLVAVLGAVLNGALVWTGTHALGWHYLAAQVAATILVLGLTYRLNRSWTFA